MSKQNKIIAGSVAVVLVGIFLLMQGSTIQSPPPPQPPPVGLVPIDGGLVTLIVGGLFLGLKNCFNKKL